jgi:hypothetical protein
MKPAAFTFAIVADQISSRAGADRVPNALAALSDVTALLPFERTAGDEIQALLIDPSALVSSILRLTRLAGWRVGVGFGTVESPLPSSTRAARGPAYLAAREAIGAARRQPTGLALRLGQAVTATRYGELHDAATDAETALWLWRGGLSRRSQEGWELMDLLDSGLTNTEAAKTLGVSPSAVSQRLAAAAREESRRGALLCEGMLRRMQLLAAQGAA